VVSDGPSDSTRLVVAEFQERLPVIYREQEKRGVSSARNLGLREARYPLVLFLDDDVIPGHQLVSEHVAFHREAPGRECVLLGYVTWHSDIRATPFMRWYGESGALFGYSRLIDRKQASARFLYSCNVSFKTDFLRGHGGFNESLTVFEDHELGYRLEKSGMRMFYRRSAIGYHNQSFTFDQACQRLGRYAAGLNAFLSTEAGREMKKRKSTLKMKIAEAGMRILGRGVSPFRSIVDSDVALPGAVYRLFYWYHATDQAFWSQAKKTMEAPRQE
jgi:cellulose synthase/poly-beta-1,6-N-acetylglucosamine synthase-like glycosyltransferase